MADLLLAFSEFVADLDRFLTIRFDISQPPTKMDKGDDDRFATGYDKPWLVLCPITGRNMAEAVGAEGKEHRLLDGGNLCPIILFLEAWNVAQAFRALVQRLKQDEFPVLPYKPDTKRLNPRRRAKQALIESWWKLAPSEESEKIERRMKSELQKDKDNRRANSLRRFDDEMEEEEKKKLEEGMEKEFLIKTNFNKYKV